MVPGVTLVTLPLVPMVATPVLVLSHSPPAIASLNEVVAPPSHRARVPDIAGGVPGKGFTVTITVAAVLPQLFAIV